MDIFKVFTVEAAHRLRSYFVETCVVFIGDVARLPTDAAAA